MPTALRARSEIPVEHTWDAASVFPTDAAWRQAVAELRERVQALAAFRGRLADSAQVLADALDLAEELRVRSARINLYAQMHAAVDSADQRALGLAASAQTAGAEASAGRSFIEPELLTIEGERLATYLAAEPRLRIYARRFDLLERHRPYVRCAEVEDLLGQLGEPFGSAVGIHGTLANAELRFDPVVVDGEAHELGQSNLGGFLRSHDRDVRHQAWTHYADAHLAAKNTMARCLLTGVKQGVFRARARNHASTLDASLHGSQIPRHVFDQLIATYRRHLPTWHRYWRLLRQAHGFRTLRVSDIKAPLTAVVPQVPYETAVDWILEAMRPLGEDYVEASRRGLLEQRWVDIYPNKGKRLGAFSSGAYGTHPFIFMSYSDDLQSMSTLAHELGHSMHTYLAERAQPLPTTGYTLFAAEIASNTNQALTRAHLMATRADDDVFQIALLEEALSNFHRYFFVMPTLARFEQEVHARVERRESLTARDLGEIMNDAFAEGYGGEVEADDERIGITWAQFSTHLYNHFYVYQYATGIAGAHAFAKRILDGVPGATAAYLGFLAAGSSLDPLVALDRAGVDMRSSEPVEAAFAVLDLYIDRLESLLGAARNASAAS